MNKTASLLRKEFQTSSSTTPEFKAFVRTFKKEFNQELEAIGATDVKYSIGHFYISGFYTLKEQVYYFRLSDVRFFKKEQLLIRTAKSYNDFTGGSNHFVQLKKDMGAELLRI